jgi:hypothetical protein
VEIPPKNMIFRVLPDFPETIQYLQEAKIEDLESLVKATQNQQHFESHKNLHIHLREHDRNPAM